MVTTLRRAGYRVLESSSGSKALSLVDRDESSIDLVVSDVVMPQMSGPEFTRQLAELGLHPKILYVSGYTDDRIQPGLLDETKASFLPKPHSMRDLLHRVRTVLDTSR